MQSLRTRGVDLARLRPVRWGWRYRIPIGYLSLLLGGEGVGKGTLAAWIAARLTRGELPGDLEGHPVNVLWVGDEDSFDSVVYPRLVAAGADVERVRTLADGEQLDNLGERADALAETIRAERFGGVFLDHLLDHLGGGLDDWRQKQVREAIRPVRVLARESEIIMLANLHPNKGAKASFRDLVSGSHQFNALSRSSLLLAAHPEDETRRVLVRGKGNLSVPPPSFEFAVDGQPLFLNGHPFHVPVLRDECEGDIDVEGLLKGVRGRPVLDQLIEDIDRVGTGEPQRRADIARAVGRRTDDRYVNEALTELEDEGRWRKVGTGKWVRVVGIGASRDSNAKAGGVQ